MFSQNKSTIDVEVSYDVHVCLSEYVFIMSMSVTYTCARVIMRVHTKPCFPMCSLIGASTHTHIPQNNGIDREERRKTKGTKRIPITTHMYVYAYNYKWKLTHVCPSLCPPCTE